jgi:hypothetical protein
MFMIDIVADKIEKRRELGISDSLVVRFVSFGEATLNISLGSTSNLQKNV